jgi:predicted Holliday junction resolvase-like endonuclease
MAYKCLPVIILLLMIVIGILSGFIGMYTNQIQRLKNEVKTRDDDMLQMQKKINVTRRLNEIYKERESRHDNRISALKFLISEYENNNTKLNKQLVELEENESKIYI